MKFGIVVRKKLPSNCEFRENWHSDCDSVLCGVMECLPKLWVFIGRLFGILSFVNIGRARKAILNEGHK